MRYECDQQAGGKEEASEREDGRHIGAAATSLCHL